MFREGTDKRKAQLLRLRVLISSKLFLGRKLTKTNLNIRLGWLLHFGAFTKFLGVVISTAQEIKIKIIFLPFFSCVVS